MAVDKDVMIFKPEMVSIDPTARIDWNVRIEGGLGVIIEKFVHIASNCGVNIGGGELIMKEGSAMAYGSVIVTGSNKLDGYSMSAAAPKDWQSVERGKVVIEENAIIYVNAVISPNVTIGRGAAILPGAVVTQDVPAYEIWGGVPAKRIGVRDMIDKPATRNGDAILEDL